MGEAIEMYESVIAAYTEKLKRILNLQLQRFSEDSIKVLPVPGVYVIYDNNSKQIIYAGRSKNLRRRLLSQHKRGNIRGSQFRKALGQKYNLKPETEISDYITNNCSFQLLEVKSFEEMVRLEHFITAILAPALNTELRQ